MRILAAIAVRRGTGDGGEARRRSVIFTPYQRARHLQPFRFMGILDDAIRQHLELKRQHGAPSTDLDRLEHEAFGPATRPGDPEFETGEQVAPSSEAEASAAVGESVDSDVVSGDAVPGWSTGEDPTTVAPQAAAEAPAAAEHESVEQPIAPPPEAPEGAIFDVEDVDLGEIEPTPAERARMEHADLEDTSDHPAPEVASLSEELEAAAPTLASEPDSAEAEIPPPAPPVEEPEPGDPEVPSSVEEPESIEFEELPGETVEPAAASAEDEEEGDEDLLEETPDFLKDAPDGEDLWFEQGAPKDFDFDD
jgi:hypothetical protein